MARESRPHREGDKDWAKNKAWRQAVFERDNYTCQNCGVRGVKLQADHIKMWSLYPELRYEISNGQTLCVPCHQIKTANELRIYWKNQYGGHKKEAQGLLAVPSNL